MAIVQVTYARLYNLGNYENERIEVAVSVENGDVEFAYITAEFAVETEHARLVDSRRTPARAASAPASQKQRNYIATLQDELTWHSEQLAVYAKEQGIDLVGMTTTEASKLIDGMRRLAAEGIPF